MFGFGRKSPRVRAKDIALPASADDHPFTLVRGGYSVGEVATFVAAMSADMTTLTPQELRKVAFTTERRGYDKAEVLAYLNRVATEIEAELDIARAQARRARVLANDPSLAVSESTAIATHPTEPELRPRPASGLTSAGQPEPSPVEPGRAPQTEVIYFAASHSPDPTPTGGPDPAPSGGNASGGRAILWLSENGEEVDIEPVAPDRRPPPTTGPDPTASPRVELIDPAQTTTPPMAETRRPPAADEPAPRSPSSAATSPEPEAATAGGVDPATEIGDLLRAAHDSAIRLRANAEADMKASIEAARVEIDERTRTQHRELDDARARAERHHAEIVHAAELTANETRATAELDAARTRAAAEAVLTQARVEVEAVKALARHNLHEIEVARDRAVAEATEMLGLGKNMLLSISELDRDLAARLVHTRSVLRYGHQALEAETS